MDFYNHTRKLFANDEVDVSQLYVMLVDGDYVFDPTETVMTDAAAEEVSGNGWDAGGEDIPNTAVTTVNTNESKLDGDDVVVTATGGSIGPAAGMVVFDKTGANAAAWKPLFYYDFPSAQTAGVGTDFRITWNASGIATWEAP